MSEGLLLLTKDNCRVEGGPMRMADDFLGEDFGFPDDDILAGL